MSASSVGAQEYAATSAFFRVCPCVRTRSAGTSPTEQAFRSVVPERRSRPGGRPM